jgi:polyether ionophore transport system permease protein
MSWLFALRLGRWGGLGFGAFAFVLTSFQAAGFYSTAGHSAAQRAAFGRAMSQVAGQFTVIIPEPLRPDTVGGYVQWRAYGFLAVIVAVWALASATGAVRGDEDRGLVETVVASGVPRADALVWRFLSFSMYAALAAVAAALGYVVGVRGGHENVDWGGLTGASLDVLALALCCYSIVLLVSQLTSSRLAAAASGTVLLALFLLNSLGRTLDGLRSWRWLSPFHYYDASRPLAPGGALDVRAVEILVAIAAVAGLLAAVAFAYRDLGSPLWRPPTIERSTRRSYTASFAWRITVVRGLYDRRFGIAAWAIGLAFLAVIFVGLTKQLVKPLLGLEGLQPYFNTIITGDIYPTFLGFLWFGFAQLLVAGYAITQVARWSAEDGDGRLEMALATPMPRTAVVIERAITLALATLLITAAAGFAVGFESHREGIGLDAGRLSTATLLLVPFATFYAAIGSVLAARIPRAAVGLLAAVAIASYFVTQVGPLFRWPAWTQDLSPFHLYGQPMTAGVDGFGLTVMLLVTLVGFAASAFLLQRRDLGT